MECAEDETPSGVVWFSQGPTSRKEREKWGTRQRTRLGWGTRQSCRVREKPKMGHPPIYSGFRCRAVAGGLIGNGRIAQERPPFNLLSLCTRGLKVNTELSPIPMSLVD